MVGQPVMLVIPPPPPLTDAHCWIQGRARDVVVWKANCQYPIAVLHQSHGITVPAVAIERSPWGQQPQAEALRLVSCSDTGKASPSLSVTLLMLL